MPKIKKSKNKKTGIKILIFILILIVFICKSITGFAFKKYKTVFPTYKHYTNTYDVKGYNIFKEKVYFASGDGILLFNANEGQKVPLGFEVASINLMNDTSHLKDELIRINTAMSYKKQGVNKNLSDLENIYKIQDNIKNRNLLEAVTNINDLGLEAKNLSINEVKELMSFELEELEGKKSTLLNQISKSNISYDAEFSGVVSLNVDNYENKYNVNNIDKIDYNYLDFKENTPLEIKTQVNKDDPIFKIIDDSFYYIALKFEKINKIKNFEKENFIKIYLDDIEIKGEIINIKENKKNAVVLIAVKDKFIDIYKNRVNKFKIIEEDEMCFEIPKSSIIKRNKEFGVFVEEIHGLVKFVPIKVVQPLENTSYISKGDKNSYIEVNDKLKRTITINDSIIVNPKQVEESKILN